jgi:enoyl-CoA hydratase/carnithine racemase|tara:strand:- start:25428 stop:26261 length:834 start_codon:yes stop_codon:yes gene_type:complete
MATIDVNQPMVGVRYEKSNGIATITIDRTERGNSLTPGMQAVFKAIWSDVRDNPKVLVAIINAAGERHFCTGFDVAEADSDSAADEVFVDKPFRESVFWSPYQNDVWKPVICVVNGTCVGGGHHFVVDSDIVIASRNAKFLDSHVNVGMVGAIENIGLAKRLPLGTALRMTLMGNSYHLSSQRAHQLGLVDELMETPEEARTLAREMATQMLKNSPQAMALSKRAIWASLDQGYEQSLETGWGLLRSHWTHPDFEEGPRAFGEKRDPVWNPDPNDKT